MQICADKKIKKSSKLFYFSSRLKKQLFRYMKSFFSFLLLVTFSMSLKAQTNEELSVSFIKKLERQRFDSCFTMFDTSMANKFNAGI